MIITETRVQVRDFSGLVGNRHDVRLSDVYFSLKNKPLYVYFDEARKIVFIKLRYI